MCQSAVCNLCNHKERSWHSALVQLLPQLQGHLKTTGFRYRETGKAGKCRVFLLNSPHSYDLLSPLHTCITHTHATVLYIAHTYLGTSASAGTHRSTAEVSIFVSVMAKITLDNITQMHPAVRLTIGVASILAPVRNPGSIYATDSAGENMKVQSSTFTGGPG